MTGRPRQRPGASPAAVRARNLAAFDALERQLADLVGTLERLHAPLELTSRPYCRECLTPHPCRTLRAVHPDAGTPAPPEEGSP